MNTIVSIKEFYPHYLFIYVFVSVDWIVLYKAHQELSLFFYFPCIYTFSSDLIILICVWFERYRT